MDKNAIKKYAVWARRELIERVSQKALQYGISADGKADPNADNVNGKLLTDVEKKQRQALIRKINEQGYEQVMEEVAYTWFNRFAALRFMEVNGYLPSHVRVFTNDDGEFKPQILSEAIHLEMDGLKMEKVYELKNENRNEELFKYLLITQCNALSSILPGMFQKIEDYTELLLPDNLLREGSVVEQMVNQKDGIPESDWTDQVQIIGWLYQYYNTEPKDKVFADLKKNIKITRETIPAATQLFTPDWIVHYMVENSLGRLWLEGHSNDALKSEWKYYLDEAEQEAEVQKQLDEIRKEYAKLKPEEIQCIDPCMGSGHILCVLFDTLVRIYEDYGYTAREAAASIVENNLWGLDIDERAAQLSYFAVMMKARQYDRRFFSRGIQPHVYAIDESNHFDSFVIDYFCDNREELSKGMQKIIEELYDAKEYGSIIDVTPQDWPVLFARFDEVEKDISMHREVVLQQLKPIVQVAQALAQKYHAVVTNPPYMGSSGMGTTLTSYLKINYPVSKSDLSTVFMEKTMDMCCENGLMAMINIPVWMFLSSYEKLRVRLLGQNTISSMVHPGRGIFGSDFGTTSFVFIRGQIKGFSGKYCRLFKQQGEVKSNEEREEAYLSKVGQYSSKQEDYSIIPGTPIAYWATDAVIAAFENQLISNIAFSDGQILTGNNNMYLRSVWEVAAPGIMDRSRWVLHAKGGEYRRWYGNIDTVVSWSPTSIEHYKKDLIARFPKEHILFRKGITWSLISSSDMFGMRLLTEDTTFNKAAATILFENESLIPYVLGFLNSVVARVILNILNPTLNTNIKDILALPIIINEKYREKVSETASHCIEVSKADWDSFETSWDFQSHPLAPMPWERQEQLNAGTNSEVRRKAVVLLSDCYSRWEQECEYRFSELKKNEEELNRIFIDIYGLQDELTPEVEDKDVTVRKADLQRDIRSLISYAVGCMFGRYSLDVPGLAYAGGEWDMSRYMTFQPDKDAIIPICDDEYFEDDIVGRFVTFIEVVYGRETLEENLQFIAQALGGKGTSREVIRNYFISDFYKDHCKVYQKRPIYWLFDSGRKNGFKCLVYLHRYQPDTIARIRTDYVHEQQSRYRTSIADLEQRVSGASTAERVKLNKKLQRVQAQAAEIREYEEKIHHLADQMIRIDLDDGVRHNYEIFKDVLAKIK